MLSKLAHWTVWRLSRLGIVGHRILVILAPLPRTGLRPLFYLRSLGPRKVPLFWIAGTYRRTVIISVLALWPMVLSLVIPISAVMVP